MSRLYRNPDHPQYGSGVLPGGYVGGRNQNSNLRTDGDSGRNTNGGPEYHQFATHSPKNTNQNPYQQMSNSNPNLNTLTKNNGSMSALASQGQAAGQKRRDGDLYYDRFAKNTGSVPNFMSTGPYMVQNQQAQQSNMPYGTPQS